MHILGRARSGVEFLPLAAVQRSWPRRPRAFSTSTAGPVSHGPGEAARVDSEAAKTHSVDADEVAKFAALSGEWWNPAGEFALLHKLNPVRVGYIRDQWAKWSPSQPRTGGDKETESGGTEPRADRRPSDSRAVYARPFDGLKLLDVGCGGGILSESLARLGGSVVGIDAVARNVNVAQWHSRQSLTREQAERLSFRNVTAEQLAFDTNERFDIVVASEVVEHVADPKSFVHTCCELLKPNGCLIISTINKSLKSYFLTVFMAEYVLNQVAKGTHDFSKFVTPSDLQRAILSYPSGLPASLSFSESAAMEVKDVCGVMFHPISRQWMLTNASRTDVNYFLTAQKIPKPVS